MFLLERENPGKIIDFSKSKSGHISPKRRVVGKT
jgi:hypothetical protein